MSANKSVKFEDFLQESFEDGIKLRELRLSSEELLYVKEKFPGAVIKSASTQEDLDRKAWYEINLSPNNEGNELEVVQLENERLKQELESLKQSMNIVTIK
ncbi:hypothetical protein [Bacillus sp. MRMR6]|uniref:hypothetical protein n=1 Tax=Bacillus sp. MRMR6 TaxID=1928617 RepID=UPI000952C767|nr:hypothetical protein [Bacillus sp. MRMR6]OLS41288.1 hypothetical protein BTR25_05365 [Bacillus sp. MRMR6]